MSSTIKGMVTGAAIAVGSVILVAVVAGLFVPNEPATTTSVAALSTTTSTTVAPTTTVVTTTRAPVTTTTAPVTTTEFDTNSLSYETRMQLAIGVLKIQSPQVANESDDYVRDVLIGACVLTDDYDSGAEMALDWALSYPDEAEFLGAVIGVVASSEICPTYEQDEKMREAYDFVTGFAGDSDA